MNFNDHSDLAGKHAFLSPSSYHWINYTDQKLEARFSASLASRLGTDLHNFASEAIRLGVKLPKSPKTLNMYVNDCIGYKMTCEVPLYYSRNAFGHTDAIAFRKNKLKISDLKTGITAASFHQLEVYVALFCLEYGVSPLDIDIELRIYQNDEVQLYEPTADVILEIMDKIVDFDQQVEDIRERMT